MLAGMTAHGCTHGLMYLPVKPSLQQHHLLQLSDTIRTCVRWMLSPM